MTITTGGQKTGLPGTSKTHKSTKNLGACTTKTIRKDIRKNGKNGETTI
jgi:hypothetical protein